MPKEMILHIVPHTDIHPHELKSTCDCIPVMQLLTSGDILIIHDAFDGSVSIQEVKNLLKKYEVISRS